MSLPRDGEDANFFVNTIIWLSEIAPEVAELSGIESATVPIITPIGIELSDS